MTYSVEVTATVRVRQLPSGWWHIRGRGPCNWSQPPIWPCSESVLREHAFPQASEKFFSDALKIALDSNKEVTP